MDTHFTSLDVSENARYLEKIAMYDDITHYNNMDKPSFNSW